MLIILGILLFSGLSLGTSLPQKMADIAAPFHRACYSFAPHTTEIDQYRAIVCGTPLGFSSFRDELRQTGLIHLLVVSGSHVAFLETVLVNASRHFPLIRHTIPLLLLLFALVNLLEAVVMRALFSLFLRRVNERFHLSWGEVQILFMAGLLAMGFCKGKYSLLSLCLSWLLSLALLNLDSPVQPKREPTHAESLIKNARAYLFVAPGLLPFSLPHPASILCNFVFAPVMGFALFPASLLAFFIPGFTTVSDRLWRIVKEVVRFIASYVPPGLERCEIPLTVLLAYVAALSFFAWRKESRRGW